MGTATRKNRKRAAAQKARATGLRRSAEAAFQEKARPRRPPPRRRRGLTPAMKTTLAIGAAVVVLGAIFYLGQPHHGSGPGQYKSVVGDPGPGQQAPPIKLSSTAGGTFDLSSTVGKTTLLYFQEGLTCQPCWDQLKDIEAQIGHFRALGIDQVVSITTDPVGAIRQKVADEGISSPVLSDPDLAVSQAYNANSHGMMGSSRDGHSFIVVGPDGTILWRADYGGAPDFTMYLPVPNLLADIRTGLGKGST